MRKEMVNQERGQTYMTVKQHFDDMVSEMCPPKTPQHSLTIQSSKMHYGRYHTVLHSRFCHLNFGLLEMMP